MTKRQFLKRCKKALQENGKQIISLQRLMNQEARGEISDLEVQRRLDVLRRDVEETFSNYEKMNPPSKCFQMYHEVLNGLVVFFESIVNYSEYLQAKKTKLEVESLDLFKKSNENLQKYKELSLKLSKQIDLNLNKKIIKKDLKSK